MSREKMTWLAAGFSLLAVRTRLKPSLSRCGGNRDYFAEDFAVVAVEGDAQLGLSPFLSWRKVTIVADAKLSCRSWSFSCPELAARVPFVGAQAGSLRNRAGSRLRGRVFGLRASGLPVPWCRRFPGGEVPFRVSLALS